MSRPKYVPPEYDCETDEGVPATVRYDYDAGETQWFDARAGVGSPGYPASICVTEVRLDGSDWTDDLDLFDPAWIARIEERIGEMISEREQDRWEP